MASGWASSKAAKSRELGWIVKGASLRVGLFHPIAIGASRNELLRACHAMATTGRNIVIAIPYTKRLTSGMTRWKWLWNC